MTKQQWKTVRTALDVSAGRELTITLVDGSAQRVFYLDDEDDLLLCVRPTAQPVKKPEPDSDEVAPSLVIDLTYVMMVEEIL